MKKLLVVILSLTMALSMAVTGFAASFVSSPSGNSAPEIEEIILSDPNNCSATVVITPYSQRNTLSATAKATIEGAYDEIKATNDVSALNADLAALAKSKEIKGTNLAVSDLFDASWVGCDDHVQHGITLTIKAETLKNFVGLLCLVDGEWKLVSGATVNGKLLTFEMIASGPYAIVVDATPDSPPTSDNGSIYLLAAIAALSLAAAVVCFKKSRKEGAN